MRPAPRSHAASALAIVALCVALAGCVSNAATTPPSPGPAQPTKDPFDATAAWSFNFTSSHCLETDLVFFEDPAALQKLLPSGFHTADAATLAGLPAPTGKAAALLSNVVCHETSIGPVHESALGILVQPPRAAGSREAALYDFYDAYRYMETPNETAPFDSLDWDHGHANVTSSIAPPNGAGLVEHEGTTLLSFAVTAPAAKPLGGIGRYWHVAAGGLAYMDYELSSNLNVGSADCAIAPGSPFAKVLGTTTCAPSETVGAMFDPYALKASIVNLPGAAVS
jgi:hypothetical protein